MAVCRNDVRNHILKDINETFITNRETFKQVSPEKVIVTNIGKAQNRNQAYEIANTLINRVKDRYQGLATGIIKEEPSMPIEIEFAISDRLIEMYYQAIPETQRLNQGKLFQGSNIKQSKASAKTIKIMQEFFNRNNIEVINLDLDYLKKNGYPTNIGGIADLAEKALILVNGKENRAITEEAMHFLTAMIAQNNPSLYNQLLNQIGKFQLYQRLLNDPAYTEAYRDDNGKLNVPKLKFEAIGKVLAEYVILKNEGSLEKPENLQLVESWLDKIINWLKSLINKAGFNPLELIAEEFLEGKVDETFNPNDPRIPSDVFFNIDSNEYANELFQKFKEQREKFKLTKHEEKGDDEDSNSYYTVEINGKQVKTDRTTDWAKEQNRKQHGGKDPFENATEDQKKEWTRKAMQGSAGHSDIENVIKAALNPDGTVKPKEEIELNFKPQTNPAVFDKLVKFLLGVNDFALKTTGFLYTFPPGTKFTVEEQIFNDKVKPNGRAGTMDLVAVLPDKSVRVYDWKFMGFSTKTNIDQPIQKRRQHALQLGDYKNTLKKAYGVEKVDAFTVPIHATYKYRTVNNEKVPFLSSVTIGQTNIKDEKRTYLLPVTPVDQSSGNADVDVLIEKLQSYYKKLYEIQVSPELQYKKNEDLNKLSVAIRHLQARLSFENVAVEAENFKNTIQQIINNYKNANLDDFTEAQLSEQLGELISTYNSADTFGNLDNTFIKVYGNENLSKEDEKLLNSLRNSSATADEKKEEILDIIEKYVEHIAKNHGINNVLTPEKEVKGIINTFTEALNLPSKMIKLFATINTKARSYDALQTVRKTENFTKLYLEAQKIVETKGKNAFDLIADPKTMKLKRKTSKEFWEKLNKAKENKDKKFILENIDKDKYNELVKEEIAKREVIINDTIYSTDERINKNKREAKLKELKNSLDINSKDFNGFKSWTFSALVNKSIIEEAHYTPEFEEIRKEPAVLALYNFIFDLNKQAYSTGYLKDFAGMRFLPFIEGTIIDRLLKSENKGKAIKDLVKESYIVTANEEAAYGKVDEETGKPKKIIPRYFTRQDKGGDNYSKDLLKIIPLYIKALQEFETSSKLEDVFMGMYVVEKNKGHLEVDRNGNVITEGDNFKVFEGNENADLLLKNIEDSIFGIKQETDTIVDVAIDKISKSDEGKKEVQKLSAKKAIEKSNKFTQGLAIGLKALVAIPNYFGGNMQAVINAGGYYSWKDYLANHAKVVGSAFTSSEGNIKKGLIDLIVPLNDDPTERTRRKAAWKQSSLKWLSSWTFQDVLMSTNRIPDQAIQFTNAISWLENSMVVDGKIVNISQWVAQNDREAKYKPGADIKAIEKASKDKIKELKETKSLVKTAKFNSEGYLEIPDVDINSQEFANFRNKIIEYGRYITGQMSSDNKADYRRNIITSSFMMFKNWIPKQLFIRHGDIQKNTILDDWEYGRTRLFVKTLVHLGYKNITDLREIIKGSPKGLQIMSEMLEQKKEDYRRKTGQELEITPEEFYDLVRKQIKNQFKELAMLISILGVVLGAKLANPDDDDDKNKYKFLAKAINKISDELWFYYSPTSAESITRGSVFPSLSLLTRVNNALTHTGQEILGIEAKNFEVDFFNEDIREKNKALKYWINLVPVASQFQNELLPIIDPEMAKELGIKTTSEARALR